MGWIVALLLLIGGGLAVYFLFIVWNEKTVLSERLRSRDKQLVALEAEAKSVVSIQSERDKLAAAYNSLRSRVRGIVDADAEKNKVVSELKLIVEKFNTQLNAAKVKYATDRKRMDDELVAIESSLVVLRAEHNALSEEAALAQMGFYNPHFGFATSERYEQAIKENYRQQKKMLAAKVAAVCTMEWMIDGSVEKGKKQTDKTLSLMLRAFNGECDSAIAKVKATNFQTMENRVDKSFEVINKLGEPQGCQLSDSYKSLRVSELQLEYEHAQKLQAEREEQRAIKDEMRQQAIAEREVEKAQQDAEREERQYEGALEKARKEFEQASTVKQDELRARLAELEQLVADAHAKKERAVSRAQQTRSGHVYVISNIGSFGNNVFKIGMTRRLDPMDRIWELSDASVPFDFDVHAIIYTEDAPGLETELHQQFSGRRINFINQRKEFFHVTMDEIAAVVRQRCGDIELTLVADASEYLQSEAYRRNSGQPSLSSRAFSESPTV